MPVAYVDLPTGLGVEIKKKLMKEVFEAMHHAWMIPDTRVFFNEWPADQISIDGKTGTAMRPIINYHGPRLPIETKRELVSGVSSAIAKACNLPREDVPLPSGKTVSTTWVLQLFSEYPLDRASLDDLMALENPMVLEAQGVAHASEPAA
jgi:phenylpyruvate tautomerase PptA (4-oxalocrotonate tautomerase family)